MCIDVNILISGYDFEIFRNACVIKFNTQNHEVVSVLNKMNHKPWTGYISYIIFFLN